MKDRYQVVIVGGGPGGYSAALYCTRAALSTLVLEKLSVGGQMATTGLVENYPGFDEGIDGYELAEKMQNAAHHFGAETEYATVEAIDFLAVPKKITTSEGVVYADSIVIATGAYPRELGLKEESQLRGRGVAYCATCDGMMYKGKEVVIVGGGNSAIADALYLEKICKKVTLIHRRDSLRASKVYEKQLAASKIEFLWNARVIQILHEKKVNGVIVENVLTKETKEISCEGVFVAIGRVPDTQLCQGIITMDAQGYIVADETTRTNIPGVFAVGDARSKPLRQIVTAASDGAVASKFIEAYIAQVEQ